MSERRTDADGNAKFYDTITGEVISVTSHEEEAIRQPLTSQLQTLRQRLGARYQPLA